jgi:hypothetical protein
MKCVMSQVFKAAWNADEELRRLFGEAQKAAHERGLTESSEILKAVWADPEVKKRMAAAKAAPEVKAL